MELHFPVFQKQLFILFNKTLGDLSVRRTQLTFNFLFSEWNSYRINMLEINPFIHFIYVTNILIPATEDTQ